MALWPWKPLTPDTPASHDCLRSSLASSPISIAGGADGAVSSASSRCSGLWSMGQRFSTRTDFLRNTVETGLESGNAKFRIV